MTWSLWRRMCWIERGEGGCLTVGPRGRKSKAHLFEWLKPLARAERPRGEGQTDPPRRACCLFVARGSGLQGAHPHTLGLRTLSFLTPLSRTISDGTEMFPSWAKRSPRRAKRSSTGAERPLSGQPPSLPRAASWGTRKCGWLGRLSRGSAAVCANRRVGLVQSYRRGSR